MLFCYKNHVFVTHSLPFFLEQKQKRNLLEKLFFFIKKKLTRVIWEIPREEVKVFA